MTKEDAHDRDQRLDHLVRPNKLYGCDKRLNQGHWFLVGNGESPSQGSRSESKFFTGQITLYPGLFLFQILTSRLATESRAEMVTIEDRPILDYIRITLPQYIPGSYTT